MRAAITLAAIAALTAQGAGGADWRVTGTASAGAGFGLFSNQGSPGAPRATGRLGLDIVGRAPTWDVRLSPGAQIALTEDGFSANSINPSLSSGFNWRPTPRHRFNGSLSATPQFVDDARFERGGSGGSSTAVQTTFAGSLGMSYLATPRDRLSLGANFGARRYFGGSSGLENTERIGLSAGWTRELAPDLSASLNGGYTLFFSDEGMRQSGQITGGFTWRATPRLTLNGSLGPSFSIDENGAVSPGVAGSLGASYAATPDTSLSFRLSQSVDQNSDGDLVNVVSASAGLNHAVNSRSSFGLTSGASVTTPIDGGESVSNFSVGANYSYRFTRDWAINAGYSLRATQDDDFELRDSVSFNIVRSLDILR